MPSVTMALVSLLLVPLAPVPTATVPAMMAVSRTVREPPVVRLVVLRAARAPQASAGSLVAELLRRYSRRRSSKRSS